MADLTVAEKLLVAAAKLDKATAHSFTAEDLVVAAWHEFPEAFGLRGYLDEENRRPKYPDSNRVLTEIMRGPIRQNGWLEKVGNKRYRLTEAGRQRAYGAGTKGSDSSRKAPFDRRVTDEVRRLLGSRAVAKYRSGQTKDITFHDACAFWGISPRSSAQDLTARLAHFGATLDTVEQFVTNEDFVLRHGAAPNTKADLEMLRDVSSELAAMFRAELAVIAKRTDER